jgi:hypothetical protein
LLFDRTWLRESAILIHGKELAMTEQEMTELLTDMLGSLPGVSSMNYGKRANFMIGEKKKIFAFTRKDGVALKLSAERVQALTETRGASALVMGKKTMKEWAVMPYSNAAALKKDLKLLKEAMAFTEAKR